jgi:hypothetical protein
VNARHEAIEWVPLFPTEQIPFILAAVLRCASGLRKERATELENSISDRLRDLLDQDPELRGRPVELFREVPLYDRQHARKKPLGRSDVMFLFSTGGQKPWPYFVIESKRLRVTFPSGRKKGLVSEYVTGNQGMMCFIEQRYGQGLASGGMLGYVFDGDIEKARISVAGSIEATRERLRTAPPFKLVLSSVLPGDSRVSETIHALAHGAFIIYHLFVAV